MAEPVAEKTLEETPTWAVAVVCFVLVVISIIIEHIIHVIGSWLKRKHKIALYESLEKIKAELMLLGFISLLLTVLQGPISDICVPPRIAATWHPCERLAGSVAKFEIDSMNGRKLLDFSDFSSTRRSLAVSKGYDQCGDRGQVAFVSAYGIHQLHIFIFVLAFFHILYGIATLAFGSMKMKKWKVWEDETKTVEYQYSNDPERFRFARDTSFGQRHLNFWSKMPVTLWLVCFFRQFLTSVTKTDYLTLRNGFIMAHLAPGSERKFNFQKYIRRSLEEDFKVVVSITPLIWFFAMLFLISNTYSWFSYLWLPFIPLIIILLVGTKLQVIITKMGLRILDRGDVVKGAPVVKPGDDLFWFGRPRLILFLIHFCLFQNAFQLAFFAWSTYEFGLRSCFHQKWEDIGIRLSMGVLIQFLCSYVTLPLYALVTQMGSTMRPTIFNEQVAAALRSWHMTARRHVRKARHSGTNSPVSSRPGTPARSVSPSHGLSPVHLLQNYRNTVDVQNFHALPRVSAYEKDTWEEYNQNSVSSTHSDGPREALQLSVGESSTTQHQYPGQKDNAQPQHEQHPDQPEPAQPQHEVNIPLSVFSFGTKNLN